MTGQQSPKVLGCNAVWKLLIMCRDPWQPQVNIHLPTWLVFHGTKHEDISFPTLCPRKVNGCWREDSHGWTLHWDVTWASLCIHRSTFVFNIIYMYRYIYVLLAYFDTITPTFISTLMLSFLSFFLFLLKIFTEAWKLNNVQFLAFSSHMEQTFSPTIH